MANIGSRYAPTPISAALAPVQRMSALSPNDYMQLLQGPINGGTSGLVDSVPSIAGLPSMNDVTAMASNIGLMGVPGFGPIAMALNALGFPATPSMSINHALFGFLSSVVDDLSLALAPTDPTAPTSISNNEATSLGPLGTSSVAASDFGFDMGLDLGLADTSVGSDDGDSDGGDSDGGGDY